MRFGTGVPNYMFVNNGNDTFTPVKKEIKIVINCETGSVQEQEHFDLTLATVCDLTGNDKKRKALPISLSSTLDSSSSNEPQLSPKHPPMNMYPEVSSKPIKGIRPRGLFDESDSDVEVIEFDYVEEIYVPVNEEASVILHLTTDSD
jgi:hypothetical protein